MKIYTNEGNPFGLKLQLLAKFAKREVVVEKVNLNGKYRKGGILHSMQGGVFTFFN